jgi:hypothetical protein
MCGKKGLSQLEGILRLKLKYVRTSKRSSAWPCPESLPDQVSKHPALSFLPPPEQRRVPAQGLVNHSFYLGGDIFLRTAW